MVLLSNDNHMIIKKNHMLKCLEKKRNSFKIFVEPLKEQLKEEETVKSNNIDLNCENLKDDEIKKILQSIS